MAYENPDLFDKEVEEKFRQNWGGSQGPQRVEGQEITKDRFFSYYKEISSILGDEKQVRNALIVFENHMYEAIPKLYRYAPTRWRNTKEETIKEVANYLKSRNKTQALGSEKNPQLKKLFSTALLALESKIGFDKRGDVVTLSGGIDGEIFARDLICQGRRWKDVGVPGNHGEYTHRLQWYIIAIACPFSEKLVEIYCQIGKWLWKREASPSYLALWDVLFDRHDTANPFPPYNKTDFRSPENLCNWIIKAENEESFPLLHAYLKARFEKRRDKDFSIKDYLAIKLYGLNISDLQKEYERTGNPAKLEKIASETDSPCDLGDGKRAQTREGGSMYRVDIGTKIHERSSYAKFK